MLAGLNHITVAVDSLDTSFDFYVNLLGMTPKAKWRNGAYLTFGEVWFCLSCDKACPSQDYTHLAFDLSQDAFSDLTQRLLATGVQEWQQNTSEGDSFYFLDPNGHKLELHIGNLNSRLESLRQKPYQALVLY